MLGEHAFDRLADVGGRLGEFLAIGGIDLGDVEEAADDVARRLFGMGAPIRRGEIEGAEMVQEPPGLFHRERDNALLGLLARDEPGQQARQRGEQETDRGDAARGAAAKQIHGPSSSIVAAE